MDHNNQNDQVHGLKFFKKHFRTQKAFIGFVKSIIADEETALNLYLHFDPERMVYVETHFFPELGIFEPSDYIDIKHVIKDVKAVLNKELEIFEEEITDKFLQDLSSDSLKNILLVYLTTLVDLHEKAKTWKPYEVLGLNKNVFKLLIVKLNDAYSSFITDEKLKATITKMSYEILPEYHLKRLMPTEAWIQLKEWLDENPDELKQAPEYKYFLKHELVKKGYLDKDKDYENKEYVKIIKDTWNRKFAYNTIRVAKVEYTFTLPPYKKE